MEEETGHKRGTRHPVTSLNTLWPVFFFPCMSEPHFTDEGYISCSAALEWQHHRSFHVCLTAEPLSVFPEWCGQGLAAAVTNELK